MRLLDVQGRVLEKFGPADCQHGSLRLPVLPPSFFLIQYRTEKGWNRQPLLVNP
jgi:hypothetical protein